MNWYLAKIINSISCGDSQHTFQVDEQLGLIAAIDSEEAFYKAQHAGKSGEEIFVNQKGRLVRWQFINISELIRLSNLVDGTELYSRIDEKSNGAAFIAMINNKASGIISSHIY